MQLINWSMLAVLVCFMPSLASAQVCETRGRLEVCPQTAADGSRFYRVTPHRGALYGELMGFVNEGVDERQQISEQQIDDANTSKVIYYCPGTSLCTRGICRNGVSRLVNGDDVPRHIDTVCDGTGARASRGLVAGTAYRVPAHRALTSTELVADATTTLDGNAHPLAGDVSRALGIGIEAGSDLVHAPSTLALAGLMQSVLNAQSRQVAVTAYEPPPVVVSASAEATARIIRLESELALERTASSSRLVVLWCMIGLLFIAIVALIWQHAAQRRKVLGLTAEQIKILSSKLRVEWQQKVDEALHARVVIKKDEMRDAWVTTPKFNLQYTVENLKEVIAGWKRLADVESGMTIVSGLRDGFEREAGRLRGELVEERAKPSSHGTLLTQIEQIRDKLYAVLREEFGPVLSLDEERRRVVDAMKVRDRFSTERVNRRKTFYELRGAPLTDSLRFIHEGFGQATDALDRLLGREPEEPLSVEVTRFVTNPLLAQSQREDEPTTRVNVRASEPEQGEEE